MPSLTKQNDWLVVRNHGILWLSIYGECHHPKWLSYFSEGLKPPTKMKYPYHNLLKPFGEIMRWSKSICINICGSEAACVSSSTFCTLGIPMSFHDFPIEQWTVSYHSMERVFGVFECEFLGNRSACTMQWRQDDVGNQRRAGLPSPDVAFLWLGFQPSIWENLITTEACSP